MEELRVSIENKDRLINRLFKEKSQLENEISDLKLTLSRLNKKLKSKTCVRLQISIPTHDEEPDLEIINVE